MKIEFVIDGHNQDDKLNYFFGSLCVATLGSKCRGFFALRA